MKHAYKIFFAAAVALTMSTGLQAQMTTELPNADLENWVDTLTYDQPEGWWSSHNTWAQINNITNFGLRKNFLNVQNELFCALLQTVEGDVFGVPTFRKFVPGVLTNGFTDLPSSVQLADQFPMVDSFIYGGQPLMGELVKWTGYMDFRPQDDADTAYFAVKVWDAAGAMIGQGELEVTGPTTGYELFEVDITYSVMMPEPDTMLMYVMSSRYPDASDVGTQLYIDNMAFEFNEGDGFETLAEQMGIQVLAQPNPNTGRFHLTNPIQEPVQVSVFGPNGALVAVRNLGMGRSEVVLGSIAPGLYTYRMQNAAQELVATGKVSVH